MGVGKEIKKELCLVFGHSWEVLGGASGPSSHCQCGNEATGVTGLVPGHRASGGCRPDSVCPGSQATAGLTDLNGHQLVLLVE